MKIIKIQSKYCPDCRIMELVFQEIKKEYPWLKVQNIDIEENSEIVDKYNVLSIPTFIFFSKEEKELARFSNIVEKDVLVKAILEHNYE